MCVPRGFCEMVWLVLTALLYSLVPCAEGRRQLLLHVQQRTTAGILSLRNDPQVRLPDLRSLPLQQQPSIYRFPKGQETVKPKEGEVGGELFFDVSRRSQSGISLPR